MNERAAAITLYYAEAERMYRATLQPPGVHMDSVRGLAFDDLHNLLSMEVGQRVPYTEVDEDIAGAGGIDYYLDLDVADMIEAAVRGIDTARYDEPEDIHLTDELFQLRVAAQTVCISLSARRFRTARP